MPRERKKYCWKYGINYTTFDFGYGCSQPPPTQPTYLRTVMPALVIKSLMHYSWQTTFISSVKPATWTLNKNISYWPCSTTYYLCEEKYLRDLCENKRWTFCRKMANNKQDKKQIMFVAFQRCVVTFYQNVTCQVI